MPPVDLAQCLTYTAVPEAREVPRRVASASGDIDATCAIAGGAQPGTGGDDPERPYRQADAV